MIQLWLTNEPVLFVFFFLSTWNRSFARDVTVAILVDLSEEVFAILKYPLETSHEFSFHADISFCFVKTLTTCHVSAIHLILALFVCYCFFSPDNFIVLRKKKKESLYWHVFFLVFFKRLSSPFTGCCVCNQERIKDWRLVSFAHNLAPPDICKHLSAFFVQFLFS